MKVILEGQLLAEEYMRGMNYYAKSLADALIARGKNRYEFTVFDYNRERGNRDRLVSRMGSGVRVHECNTVDYRELTYKRQPYPAAKSYAEVTGAYGDVYHFMTQHFIPPGGSQSTVVTIHDLMAAQRPEWFPNDRLRHSATMTWDRIRVQRPFIIADSKSTMNDILDKESSLSDRVFVVPLSYQAEYLYPEKQHERLMQIGVNRPYILFVSAMEIRKGVEKLVQAFDALAEKYNEVELVFVGMEYPEKVLEKSLASSRHKERIKWLGTVDDTARRILYSCAEMFVLPSLYEGFGLPVLEAMACGTPVITSNTSSLPEVAGNAAILIDPTDTEQLAHEMERVLTSDTLRKELTAKGLENCKRFSWEKTAEMTEKVYELAYAEYRE